MLKRRRIDNVPNITTYPNYGLLQSFETIGIMELVYSFLMDSIHDPFHETENQFKPLD